MISSRYPGGKLDGIGERKRARCLQRRQAIQGDQASISFRDAQVGKWLNASPLPLREWSISLCTSAVYIRA
jgi:hypothetical protein